LADLLAGPLERPEESLPFRQAAVDLEPQNGWRYLDLATAHQAAGILDPVSELLQQAADLGPTDAWLADGIGWAYIDLGQCESAVDFFNRALA
jgi:tetratricopeptide (TPR) repeat protein